MHTGSNCSFTFDHDDRFIHGIHENPVVYMENLVAQTTGENVNHCHCPFLVSNFKLSQLPLIFYTLQVDLIAFNIYFNK